MNPENNGAPVAVDFGPWRSVYPRFDLSPSGKSGGKEKETKSEQLAKIAATVPVARRRELRT